MYIFAGMCIQSFSKENSLDSQRTSKEIHPKKTNGEQVILICVLKCEVM